MKSGAALHTSKYAYALARRGETQRASQSMDETVRLARESLDQGDEFPRAHLEIAAIHAFRQQKEPALEWLQKAYDAGWRESRRMVRDPMFNSLRQEPKFKELILRIDRDIATSASAPLISASSLPPTQPSLLRNNPQRVKFSLPRTCALTSPA